MDIPDGQHRRATLDEVPVRVRLDSLLRLEHGGISILDLPRLRSYGD
jgi:hypothetical protein